MNLKTENLTKRQAFEEARSRFISLIDFFQGDKGDRTIYIIDECAEIPEFNALVDSLEEAQAFVEKGIEEELERENDLLPDEGNPGVPIGG